MQQFRQYPQANSLQTTDAFLIERTGVGTMFIEASDAGIGAGPYNIAMGVDGAIPTSTKLFVVNAVDYFYIPQNFVGSVFTVQNPPDDTIVFNITVLGSVRGTITFDSSGVGVGASDGDIEFVPGMQLVVVTPDDVSGATGPSLTFKCVFTGAGGISA